MNVEFLCNRTSFGDGIEFLIIDKQDDGHHVAEKITFKDSKRDRFCIENPSIRIDKDSAQKLIDRLWECGMRPTEGFGSVGQLASVKYHLEDMRKLVFKKEYMK